MADVKAVLVDGEWFQVYDNAVLMTETPVASGIYWNYFYNTWKTVSSSPFSNAIVFVDAKATIALPQTITMKVTDKSVGDNGTVITLETDNVAGLANKNINFIQTESATTAGVAVHKYGAIIYPPNGNAVTLAFSIDGTVYTASTTLATTANVGDTLTFTHA